MENNRQTHERIDAYLLGHMTEAEAIKFKKEIQMDKSLSDNVAKREKLIGAMAESARRELKGQLKAMHKEVRTSAKVRTFNWRPLLVAASVAVLGLMILRFAFSEGPSAQELFASNYQAFDLALTQRSDAADNRIAEANELFRNKKYQEAIPLLSALNEEGKGDQATLQMGLAIAHFETGQVERSFPLLNQIIASNNPFLGDKARWYAALFYLQQDRLIEAQPLLEYLASTAGADHNAAAAKLLQQLF